MTMLIRNSWPEKQTPEFDSSLVKPLRVKSTGWPWVGAMLVVLVYLSAYGSLIAQHTILPAHDGAGYVLKVFWISEAFSSQDLGTLLNPFFYFNLPLAVRPPLIPALTAFILGPDPTLPAIAFTFLGIKIIVLLAGLYLLSSLCGYNRFVPVAVVVILTAAANWQLDNVYLVDTLLAVFCLLAVVMLLWDDKTQSLLSSFLATLTCFLPFAIKISGPVILFPFCLLRALRALSFVFYPDSNFSTIPAGKSRLIDQTKMTRFCALFPWAIPYFLLPVSYALFFFGTDYSVGTFFAINQSQEGTWALNPSVIQMYYLLGCSVPPWLAIFFIFSRKYWRDLKNKFLIYYAMTGIVWVVAFYYLIFTDSFQDRYMHAIMPTVVSLLLAVICQKKVLGNVFLFIGLLFFFISAGVATKYFVIDQDTVLHESPTKFLSSIPSGQQSSLYLLNSDFSIIRHLIFYLNPETPFPQQPVSEVGFLQFVKELKKVRSSSPKTRVLLCSLSPHANIGTAWVSQYLTKNVEGYIEWSAPVVDKHFYLSELLENEWFVLTEGLDTRSDLSRLSYTSLHWLLLDSASPIKGNFREVLSETVLGYNPYVIGSSVTYQEHLILLQRVQPISQAQFLESLQWLKKNYHNTEILTYLDEQILKYESGESLLNRLAWAEKPSDLPDYARPVTLNNLTLNGETRSAVMLHALPGGEVNEIAFRAVQIPENAVFDFGLALHPDVWKMDKGDGVLFVVEIISHTQRRELFRYWLDPRLDKPGWRDFKVPLTEYSGQTVDLLLRIGAGTNNSYDNALWTGLKIGGGTSQEEK